MDDSFNSRVDKIFGSLAKSSSSLQSLWSLTDEEVEKREWNRERGDLDREENPCSSSFDGFFANERKKSEKKARNLRKVLDDDLEDLSDDDDERNQAPLNRSEEEKDDWEIRSSIGLDNTLDNEEEEDEYDKVAVGRENSDDRMYMRDVNDYVTYLNSYNVLPDSFKDRARDPRANDLAARIRLKEDRGAESFVSLPTSDDKMPDIEHPQVAEDGGSLKSILKRKVDHADAKAQKRVRFDPGCKDICENKVEEETQDSPMATCPTETTAVIEDTSSPPQNAAGVPDYISNPSKYTRYSFDSTTDIDESSNRQACMDFLNMIKRSKTLEMETESVAADLPKSVTFTPRKKAGEVTMKNSSEVNQNQEDASKESLRRTNFHLGIAARDSEENEACAMEEDEQQVETETEIKSNKSQRLCRQYRVKVR